MRTEVLRYIIEVDKEQSISKAATNLYISKSALSESISQLEHELNVAIFTRQKKGIETTEDGKRIINQAKNVLSEIEKFYAIGYTAPAMVDYTETIKFGVSEKFAKAGLNTCISVALQKYPNLNLRSSSMAFMDCIHAVGQGTLDFGVIAYQSEFAQNIEKTLASLSLQKINLHNDYFVCLAHKSTPLAKKTLLSTKDTKDYILISYADAVPDELFPQSGTMLLSELDNILQLVNDNVGISTLPYSFIKNSDTSHYENIAIIPMSDIVQKNCIIYHKDTQLTNAQTFFINLYKMIFDRNFSD